MNFTEGVQRGMVGFYGYTEADVDGVWGPKSDRVFKQIIQAESDTRFGTRIPSPEGWEHIQAFIRGDDIYIRNAKVTCFGGTQDKEDGGVTASGFDTRTNYNYMGISLPLRRDNVYDKHHGYVLRNSPLPAKIPWHTKVKVIDISGHSSPLECDLIELGPADWTGNTGDLMIQAARHFDPKATANAFGLMADLVVEGAAKYVI